MLKYTLPLWTPDRGGCVHADSSLKLHLSTEIIMYTEGDTTCHLMTIDPVTRTASGARQIRSPSQLTENLALLQKCFSSHYFFLFVLRKGFAQFMNQDQTLKFRSQSQNNHCHCRKKKTHTPEELKLINQPKTLPQKQTNKQI